MNDFPVLVTVDLYAEEIFELIVETILQTVVLPMYSTVQTVLRPDLQVHGPSQCHP